MSIKTLLPPDVSATDTLYVVDRKLNLVYSNDEWSRFAADNKGDKLLNDDCNPNVLENMSGKARERWKHIYHLLLDGRMPHHQEELICSSPSERRVYRLRVTPKKDDAGDVAWLVHHAVRVDEGRDVLDRVRGRLSELEDTDRMNREYRERIAAPRVTIPSFRTARHFQPLESVGGDLVWHRGYPEGLADLVIGDVAGHGEPAGRLATQIVALLDELAAFGKGPAEVIPELNRALVKISSDDAALFATGLFFRFEPVEQRLTCASMGHEGPIFSRTGEIEIENGPPVGLLEEMGPWPENAIDLDEHGARFLVFSDGITEQFNIDGEMFGTEGLLQAFRVHLDRPLGEMVNCIVDDLCRFRGPALTKDDQTLLALELID
jgi:hypothetical protein